MDKLAFFRTYILEINILIHSAYSVQYSRKYIETSLTPIILNIHINLIKMRTLEIANQIKHSLIIKYVMITTIVTFIINVFLMLNQQSTKLQTLLLKEKIY